MRVCLINYTFWPCIEGKLSSLISALQSAGHTVDLIDFVFMPKRKAHDIALQEMKSFSPEVIGISAGYDSQLMPLLVSEIREHFADIPILIGGFLPTHMLKSHGEKYYQFLKGNVWVFAGSAEVTMVDFLKSLEAGEFPERGPITCRSTDINALPVPDFTQFDMPRYLRMSRGSFPIRTSAGCPYQCTHCVPHPGPYSHKRPIKVVEEIQIQEQRHRKDGMRSICFVDMIFGQNEPMFREMMALFRKEGISERLPWYCQTRVEIVTRRWAREAARGGCRIVYLGLESGDEDVRRNVLYKTFTNEQFAQAVKNLKAAGIRVGFSLMTNLPHTSFWTDLKSVRWALSFKPVRICHFLYHPVPGTSLGESSASERGPQSFSYKKGKVLILLLKTYAAPYLISTGLAEYGFAYIRTIFRYLVNIDDARVLPLFHRFTPLLMFLMPVHTLQMEKRSGHLAERKTEPLSAAREEAISSPSISSSGESE